VVLCLNWVGWSAPGQGRFHSLLCAVFWLVIVQSMPRPTSHMAMTTTAAAAAEEQPAGLSPLAQGASAVGSGGCSAPTGSSGSSSCSVVAYYLGLHGPSPVPHFTSKNVHALRTLFNAAKYLADGLGPSWMLLVEVLYVLDRALPAAAATSSSKASCGPSRHCCSNASPATTLGAVHLLRLIHIYGALLMPRKPGRYCCMASTS